MLHHPSICVPSGEEIQKVVTDVAPQTWLHLELLLQHQVFRDGLHHLF